MKKQRDLAGNIPGLLAMTLIALALALLLGTGCAAQQAGTATTSEASPTPLVVALEASPTPISPTATPTQEMTFYSPIDTPTMEPTPTEEKPTPTPVEEPTPMPPFRAENIKVVKEVQLTTDGKFSSVPGGMAWSPDGSKIAFSRLTGEFVISSKGFTSITDIWVMNSDGSSPERLVVHGSMPTWSPDGTRIAFVSFLGEQKSLVGAVNIDTGEKEEVIDNGFSVSWLANDTLFFLKNRQVQSINLTDSTQGQLTEEGLVLDGPNAFALSPDGQKIAVVNFRDLWLMNLDGTQPLRLTEWFDNIRRGLAWSPDGSKLAYAERDGILSIVNADGTNPIQITVGGSIPWFFSWSPDSNVLAFIGFRGIYVVNADGTGLRILVPYGDSVEEPNFSFLFPSWSPDGSSIAVEKGQNLWLLLLSSNSSDISISN